jgi:hypothetical protein
MSPRRLVAAASLAVLVGTAAPATILASSGHSNVKYKHYANCTALNKDYKHGVGKPGAVDHVSGHTRKVKNFYVSAGLYKANKGSDRDGDGIACEKL